MSYASPQTFGPQMFDAQTVGSRNIAPQDNRRRIAILASVAVLHAGAFYMLVTGLAGVVTMIEPPRPLTAHDVPITVPVTPPTAIPSPHIPARPIAHDDPIPQLPLLPLDPPSPLPSPFVTDGPTSGAIGEVLPTPTPSPTPRFSPHGVVPRGHPSDWISPVDYPAQDLREGNAGVTGFHLTIGRDGRPQSCTITSSSGHPRLDAATCQLVMKRAMFKPASDDTGALAMGSYQSRVDWTIPDR